MKQFLGLLFIISFISVGFSAEIQDVLQKVKENYALNKSYSVNAKYFLYKGHNSGHLHEYYTGYTENSKFGMYQKIQHTERYMTKDYFLHISHHEKAMVLAAPVEPEIDMDISTALEKISIKKMKEDNDSYTIMLHFLGFSGVEYSSIILIVEKNSYLLKSIDIYYATHRNFAKRFSQQDLNQPHLRIVYANYKKKTNLGKGEFELNNFLKENKNQLIPVGRQADYELIDTRTR